MSVREPDQDGLDGFTSVVCTILMLAAAGLLVVEIAL